MLLRPGRLMAGRRGAYGAAASGASLLLDTYTGAVVALSPQKLRSAATTPLRVRRSSDNSEEDASFSDNNLDTSALETFCGVGNGFIATWYNQGDASIGNPAQSTTTRQPQIVSSGSTLTLNSLPALSFDGANFYLELASIAINSLVGSGYECTIAAVIRQDAAAVANTICACYTGATEDFSVFATLSDTLYARLGDQTNRATTVAQPTGWDDAQHILLIQSDGSNCVIRVDGTELVDDPVSGTPTKTTSATFQIGTRLTNFRFDGMMQAVIIWPNATHAPGDIETALNNIFSVY